MKSLGFLKNFLMKEQNINPAITITCGSILAIVVLLIRNMLLPI
jgi:hypothetical protein